MDAFLKMFQNTCFIVEQQVTHMEGVKSIHYFIGKSIHYFILCKVILIMV